MSFLNPLLLFGILAVASPIIIHLLAKRQIKRVVWAAMRFVQPVVRRNQQKMKLEDLLLLLLRCALLVLLALALARPSFRASGFGGMERGSATAIIALDQSASMSQTDGVVSRFEKAQNAAEEVLDSLPSGSAVAVWLISDTVKRVIPEPTRDFALARKVIRDAKRSDRGSELQPAVRQALEVLQRHAAQGKQLYLVTDGQATGWKALAETRAMLAAAAKDVQTRLVLVAETETHNLGVTGLRLTSALAPINETLRFEVMVLNAGTEAARDISVTLGINAEPPSDGATIESIPAGEARKISLFLKFREAGFQTVTARVQADRNPADDQRVIAVRVIGEVNVLLVDGEPGVEPRDSETFYLRNALTPVPPEARAKYFIKVHSATPTEFETVQLGEYEALVLANVVDFSETVLTALEKYLRNGGGLLVFPGPKINAAFYNTELFQARAILPAAFGTARGEADQQQNTFHLRSKRFDHPVVQIWNDPAAGTLGSAHFFRAFTLEPAQEARGRAGPPALVLEYAGGEPAVMERTWGNGRVIQFSSTADAAWNDLCARPVYVPLVHRLVGSLLARQDERLNLRTGAKFSYAMDPEMAGKDARVLAPGAGKRAASLLRISAVEGEPLLTFDETDFAGAYEVRTEKDDEVPSLRFAAQSDPDESKLEELSTADLGAFENVAHVLRWSPGAKLRLALHRDRIGTELWLAFAVAALGVLVLETVLGNRFSRPK